LEGVGERDGPIVLDFILDCFSTQRRHCICRSRTARDRMRHFQTEQAWLPSIPNPLKASTMFGLVVTHLLKWQRSVARGRWIYGRGAYFAAFRH
jgi:hypothetical protein